MQKARHFIVVTSVFTAFLAFAVHVDRVRESAADALTSDETARSYIVQGDSTAAVDAAVRAVGGEITHELNVIRAVAATLDAAQLDALRADAAVTRLYGNDAVEVAAPRPGKKDGGGKKNKGRNSDAMDTLYGQYISAHGLYSSGIDGSGVGIAVLDTGLWKHDGILYDSAGSVRIVASYDAINDRVRKNPSSGNDPAGHGTHVASIVASSIRTKSGKFNGIAPGAHLVSVQAFDDIGQGRYADVIRAIGWVVANKAAHNIRILNLSFSAEPHSHYWDDPINQAVMAAWQQDIVVVAAAGNRGPDPMTIGVPGNVPYVITVGAMTDNFTPNDETDDRLASFSSAGPTQEGFVKPDLVAPGGHMLGLMQPNSYLATVYPEFYYGGMYFEMSGTSQATGVVSGVAALILQAHPTLSADEVKCRIVASAQPAIATTEDGDGEVTELAYSIFQQGAGLVHANRAVNRVRSGCVNQGLDIDADVAGTRHFGGRANQDADGNYYLMGLEGYLWTDSTLATGGYVWTDAYTWTDGYVWTDGYLWTDGTIGMEGYLWTDGYVWTDGYLWTDSHVWMDGYLWTDALTEMASMAGWVEQE